jgi:hypothetical protein
VEGDAARLADLRAQMRAALPARVYAATMSISDPRGWDSAELPVLIAHNMAHPPGAQDGGVQNGGVQDGGVQDGGAHDGNAREGGAQDAGAQDGEAHDAGRATFFMLLRRLSLDAAQLAALPADDATQPPAVAAHLAFLRAPAADRALLARAAAAPVDFAAFTTNRDAAAARIAAAMAQLAATQRTRGRETLPLASQALVARAQAWPAPAHLLTAECYADAVATARHIVARIETATPSSVIRIGDGEGFFLPPAPRVAHRMAEDRVGIQSIWWGAARMDAARQEGILRDFMAALHAAGMIGIMPYRWFADSLHRDADETRYDRGTFNALHHVFGNLPDTNGLGAALTSTNFPLDLHNWGLWPAILRAAGSVSVVSCHDLAAALQARFGVHVRQAIRIPGEYRFQSAMAGAADPQASLLDQHGEVCDSLSPRLGELYLIAAGFLGKIHCDIVRARGGIAIDIGSLADYWMGFSTRAIRIAQEPAWNLADLRIRHHPLT